MAVLDKTTGDIFAPIKKFYVTREKYLKLVFFFMNETINIFLIYLIYTFFVEGEVAENEIIGDKEIFGGRGDSSWLRF